MHHADMRVLRITWVDWQTKRVHYETTNRDGGDVRTGWQTFVPMRRPSASWIVPPTVGGVKTQRRRRRK